MPKIDIDNEVYKALQDEAEPFVETTPNDVLRRILLGVRSKNVDKIDMDPDENRPGVLRRLIDQDLLAAGDRLVWNRPRIGETHYAIVLAGGCIRISTGEVFTKPSPACKSLIGQETDGWSAWHRESDNRSLKDLRSDLR
ncbi:hypothetical protein [Nonomuraea typhae]|uniref:restriction system modified-DNA reader domain-containing protein n=1 Tax=Nonomuraea typhae TaxID=2603600 RepID=UPI0012F9A100|nr:hypothetical protein [Nonomuraea typhae]